MDTVLCDRGEGTKRSLHIPMPHPRAAVTSEGSVILTVLLSFRKASARVVGTHMALRKPFFPRTQYNSFQKEFSKAC